jgi:hypothetical protein
MEAVEDAVGDEARKWYAGTCKQKEESSSN